MDNYTGRSGNIGKAQRSWVKKSPNLGALKTLLGLLEIADFLPFRVLSSVQNSRRFRTCKRTKKLDFGSNKKFAQIFEV